jgi:hypothetical protein
LQFAGGQLAVWFSKKQFLKSYRAFAALTFFVAVWGGHSYFICKQQFLQQQTVTDLFAGSFYVWQTPFVL